MVSPLLFESPHSQGEYVPKEEAAAVSLFEMQEELKDDFIPFDDDITKEIEKKIN